MLLLIYNYDSFTYNLYQYFCEIGAEVLVKRNDELPLADIERLVPQNLVISPAGPCTINEAGISLAALYHFAGKLPILGVCLGHQVLGQEFGAKVVRSRAPMHRKTSLIHHLGCEVFRSLNLLLTVTRYHSLVLKAETLLECFEVTAWSERNGKQNEIMGIHHKLALEGVQLHPASILNEQGHQLLDNFLKS